MEEDINAIRIALWGAPGAGKTWYRNALTRSILQVDTKPLNQPIQFSLVKSADNFPIIGDVPNNDSPTQFADDTDWLVRRRHAGESGSIGNATFRVIIADDKGQNLTSFFTDQQNANTTANFRSAQAVFAVFPATGIEPESLDDLWDSFANMCEVAFGETSVHSEPQYLAVILTKADQLPKDERSKSGENLMESLYGAAFPNLMTAVLKNFPTLQVEYFVVSSSGFLEKENRTPNIEAGDIANQANWRPWQTAVPLLWLLKDWEIKRVTNAGNSLAKLFFTKARAKFIESQYPT